MTPQPSPAEAPGVFPPFRAGALAGVSGHLIGQWSRYGLIKPTLYRGRPANLYEFRDVAEAIVVRWLLERGFGYGAIHRAIERSRAEFENWPLLAGSLGVAQHAVEGDPRGTIVYEVKPHVYVDTGSGGEQITLKPELLVRARDTLRRGGWLADTLKLKRIEVDPGKLGGMPVLRGRRWPIERVAQLAADEAGTRILLEDYGLDRREVTESVRWTDAAAAL
jgi:uncharacterized protein (DUF433 family)/DNA-binding transcriptional MerR regulator